VAHDRTTDPIVGFVLPPGDYTIRTDGTVRKTASDPPKQEPTPVPPDTTPGGLPAALRLTADTPGRHPIDGIGEIAARKGSFCSITVEVFGSDGNPVGPVADGLELFLRTTAGFLTVDKSGQRVRSVKVRGGRANFALNADIDPRVATVTVLGPPPLRASIDIEFVPVSPTGS
jgi:hypothetical protein